MVGVGGAKSFALVESVMPSNSIGCSFSATQWILRLIFNILNQPQLRRVRELTRAQAVPA
jgi:hypothetical protein